MKLTFLILLLGLLASGEIALAIESPPSTVPITITTNVLLVQAGSRILVQTGSFLKVQ